MPPRMHKTERFKAMDDKAFIEYKRREAMEKQRRLRNMMIAVVIVTVVGVGYLLVMRNILTEAEQSLIGSVYRSNTTSGYYYDYDEYTCEDYEFSFRGADDCIVKYIEKRRDSSRDTWTTVDTDIDRNVHYKVSINLLCEVHVTINGTKYKAIYNSENEITRIGDAYLVTDD